MDETSSSILAVHVNHPGVLARVVSGEAGYGPLVLVPMTVLIAVWGVMSAISSQWDVVSLAIGVAWVAVAQVSVLAHLRRSERHTFSGMESRRVWPIRAVWPRRGPMVIACGLLLALVFAIRDGAINPGLVVIVLGCGAMLLALYEVRRWNESGGSFPWSTVAIGCAGIAAMTLQYQAGNSMGTAARTIVAASSMLAAFCIWMGLVVRDIREVRAGESR